MTNQEIIELENYQKVVKSMEEGYDNVLSQFVKQGKNAPSQNDVNKNFLYFKIDEIAYESEENCMEKVLYALYSINISFAIIFSCDRGKLDIYVGSEETHIDEIYRIFNSHYMVYSDCLDMEKVKKRGFVELYNADVLFDEKYPYGGVIYGDIFKDKTNEEGLAIIDNLVSGCIGESFKLVIVARPFEKEEVIGFSQDWSELKNRGELIKSRQVSIHDQLQSLSYVDVSYKMSNYIELINKFEKKYSEAISNGLWETSVKYYAQSEQVAETVAGIIISMGYNEELPQPIQRKRINSLSYDDGLLTDIDEVRVDAGNPMPFPAFSNWYLSRELSVLLELPHKDTVGLPVRKIPRFELAQKNIWKNSFGYIQDRGRDTNHEYSINIDDLNRHMLVVGLTGGGKTNTLKGILCMIRESRNKVPFMIIEPAKKEYWELYNLGYKDLTIFSIGSLLNDLKINPFQKCGNITIQAHIDYVFAAFKASFIMYPPMPYVLERAIYEIYQDSGWDIEKNYNVLGEVYPTIEQLYFKIPSVVKEMGYDGREQANIVGALQARINSLRLGIKGKCLNVKFSHPIDELLQKNIIIELENIGDEETKAFIMSLIMIQVMEYRIGCEDSQKELKHLILFEEAHRLLKNIPFGVGESADPRGNAVMLFCNMLAELRSKGQGFVIADQIPSKLAPDIIKNTNLKFVHRLVDQEDRELVGKSMHMTEEQIEYLSYLEQGVGAVYSEGDFRPKLVHAPYVNEMITVNAGSVSRDEVMRKCQDNASVLGENQLKLHFFCSMCPFNCNGERIKEVYKVIDLQDIEKYASQLKSNLEKGMLTLIVSDCLMRIKDNEECEMSYWEYAFCVVGEIVRIIEATPQMQYSIYRDLLELLACIGGTPESWKE